jgi:branched-chain amino acid transport system ATP-binding protein
MTPLLQARDLSAGYGGVPVVHGLDLEVRHGEVVCLLGLNGAGKTTTMLALTGQLPPVKGEVVLDGRPTTAPLHRRARAMLSFVPEERSVFMGLSLLDNLRVAGVDRPTVTGLFPELEKRMRLRAGLLSGGEQQMVSVARALARGKPIFLGDELSLGLAPLAVDRLLKTLRDAADDRGIGVLIVEQHARKAIRYADRVLVMCRGELSLVLPGEEARQQIDRVMAAYSTRPSALGGAVRSTSLT